MSMVQEIRDEVADFAAADLLPITRVPKPGGGNFSMASVWRWTTRGLEGVRCPSYLIGGRRYVKASDLRAFFGEVESRREAKRTGQPAPAPTAEPAGPARRSPARRQRDDARARQELARRGLA